MRTSLLLTLLFSLLVMGCITTPELLVRYDDRRDLYLVDSGEKKGTVLRDEKANIIREVSDKNNLIEQYNKDPEILDRLPLNYETMGFFIRQDYTVTALYFSGVKELNDGNYETALESFNKAYEKYPGLVNYSDISFLMGYCCEQMGNPEKAAEYFKQFISKSEQKYSIRFNEADFIKPDVYRDELEYSRHYLNRETAGFNESFTDNETAKYYNNPHYPGYVVGLRPGLSSIGITILPNLEKLEESYAYLGMTYTFNSWLDAGGAIGFPLPFLCELLADFQVYKAGNRRFGISLESFFFYQYHEELIINYVPVELDPPLHYYNGGLEFGTGFYILPDLFIGGYYVYYLFNEFNKFHFESSEVSITTWNTNSYRVSLRYLPVKIADVDLSYWNSELYIGTNVYIYTYTFYMGYSFLENKFVMLLNSMKLID